MVTAEVLPFVDAVPNKLYSVLLLIAVVFNLSTTTVPVVPFTDATGGEDAFAQDGTVGSVSVDIKPALFDKSFVSVGIVGISFKSLKLKFSIASLASASLKL